MKRVLITGVGSYIGNAVKEYLSGYPKEYVVNVVRTREWQPSPEDFTSWHVVLNVAGIAHQRESRKNRHLYYDVNRDLAVKIAEAAKAGGVGQLIQLSTIAVYGMTTGHITKSTPPRPATAYGDSKYQADKEIRKLEDDSFRVACVRPPMVYGKGCRGNYQRLRFLALKLPFFPDCRNRRSMVYIGNLCAFLKMAIDSRCSGLFFPQNASFIETSSMVLHIAECNGKTVRLVPGFQWLLQSVPIETVQKVFGNLTCESVDAVGQYSFEESIMLTEGKDSE